MRAALAIAKKELLHLRAYPLDLVNYAVSPGLLVAPYILVARLFGFDPELTDTIAVGLILWYWLSTLMWEVGFGLYEEMEEGVFETVLSTPASFWAILSGRAISTFVLQSYITASMIGWFMLFDVPLWLPWPAFFGVVLLAGIGITGFMLGLAGFVLLFKRGADLPGDLLQTGLGVLAGFTMPARLLPRPLWLISRGIPLAYGIEAARRLLGGEGVGMELLAIVALGAFYALLGWWALAAADRRMRAAGTTGEF